MELEERERHRLQLSKVHEAELRTIVVLRHSEFLPELVELAREELARRGLPVPSEEAYWREHQQEWLAQAGFCYDCWSQTTDESPGDGFTANLIGVAVTGNDDPCSVCRSTIKTKHFWVFVPLAPLGRYRVIRLDERRYIGRRLKDDRS